MFIYMEYSGNALFSFSRYPNHISQYIDSFIWFFFLSNPFYLSGVALGYGLDDRRFESRQRLGISLHHRVHTGSEAHPSSYPMGTRSCFRGGKATGA
jgi:hypothetical protein